MKPESLLEELHVLAEAPNGVPELRELILQLAVQGKLVPQNPNDEPASDLFQRIVVAKNEQFNQGGRSRSKLSTPGSEDTRGIKLPNGWIWVKVGAITGKIGSGSTPLGGKRAYVAAGVKFLRSQNVWNDGLRLEGVAFIREETHSRMAGTTVHAGDLLLNITGASIGRCALVSDDFDEANVSQHVSIIRPVLSETRAFLHIALIAPSFQDAIMRTQVGISREGLSIGRISEMKIPLPPLPEQQRIAARVDELMSLCDKLEERQRRRSALRVRVNRSILHRLTSASGEAEFGSIWNRVRAEFSVLYDVPETVSELRQAILQLAVRGRLVAFGSGLVFLPLESLLAEPSLNGLSARPNEERHGTPILRISAATSRRDAIVNEEDHKYLDVDPATLERFRLDPGDLLACRFNGNLDYVGRMSLYRGYSGDVQVYPDKLIRFRLDRNKADPSYVRLVFNAGDTRREIERHCATTAGNIGISASRLKTIRIPVPSLLDQRRTVAIVDNLMSLCDSLEQRLAQAEDKGSHLAASIAHHLGAA